MTELSRLQGLGHEVQSHVQGTPVDQEPRGQDLHEKLTQKIQGLRDHEKLLQCHNNNTVYIRFSIVAVAFVEILNYLLHSVIMIIWHPCL